MTYNINYEHASGAAWWFVLWITAAVAVVVYGGFIAAKKRKYLRRFGIVRGVLTILIGVAGITTGVVFASIAHHQLTIDRQTAVVNGWGLNATDADYLLDHRTDAPQESCFFGGCDPKTPTTALVTLNGKPTQAYLLKQGDALRLIVDDKPSPVVTR